MMKTIKFILAISFLFSSSLYFAQKRGGHPNQKSNHHQQHRGKKVVVVKHSRYRPHKVRVYHPHWHPNYSYNRRWVFFPRHNMYWDNWRNQYVFWNGAIWVSQTNTPTVIVNVNLDKEKAVELKDDEDDVDDVYKANDTHKSQYKPD